MTKRELIDELAPYDDESDIKIAVDFRTDDAERVTSDEEGNITISN